VTSAKAFSAEELAEIRARADALERRRLAGRFSQSGKEWLDVRTLLKAFGEQAATLAARDTEIDMLKSMVREADNHVATMGKLNELAGSMLELKSRLVDAPDVGEIRARADAASMGPWRECGHDRGGCQCGHVWSTPHDALVAECRPQEDVPHPSADGRMANARFIAHARTDIPRLCDAMAKRDAELAEVIDALGLREDIDTGRVLVEACRQISDETTAALDELAKVNEKLRIALSWEDASNDEWTGAVNDAFPTRSGSHDEYAVALEMVGHRKSKGELVALVNWLLVRCDTNREAAWAARFKAQAEERDALTGQLGSAQTETVAWVEQFAMVNAERHAKTEECALLEAKLHLIHHVATGPYEPREALGRIAETSAPKPSPPETVPDCPRFARSTADCDECEARDGGSRCTCPCHKTPEKELAR
jgi:hypothetical protein